MSSTKRQVSMNALGEETCVVCCRSLELYAIGECDHPVCYVCSTRMRVVCRQNECPICRRELAKVVFTKKCQRFADLSNCAEPFDGKYAIYFRSSDILHAYLRLLEHVCSDCAHRPVFNTFNALREHKKKVHGFFYCDLCVDHLKIFTYERRSYNRQDLALHRREGDKDDTSHRGHPLCEFCEQRFLDKDELFRHLRRQHYFCHLCDADGLHQFYIDYAYLRKHFQKEHYLCEEGSCKEESFTAVFRTDIDLKAHVAAIHNKNLSRAQAKQARTLELKFTITPRNNPMNGLLVSSSHCPPEPNEQRPKRDGRQHTHGGNSAPQHPRQDSSYANFDPPIVQRIPSPTIDTSCAITFPSLKGGASASAVGTSSQSRAQLQLPTSISQTSTSSSDTMANRLAKINRFTIDGTKGEGDFPALGKGSSSSQSEAQVKTTKKSRVNGSSASGMVASSAPPHPPTTKQTREKLTLRINSQEEFPNLNGTSNVSIQVSRSQNVNVPAANIPSRPTSGTKPTVTRMSTTQNITLLSPTRVPLSVLNNSGHRQCNADDRWLTSNLENGVEEVAQTDVKSKTFDPSTLETEFPALKAKEPGKCLKDPNRWGMKEATVTIPVANGAWSKGACFDAKSTESDLSSKKSKTKKKNKSNSSAITGNIKPSVESSKDSNIPEFASSVAEIKKKKPMTKNDDVGEMHEATRMKRSELNIIPSSPVASKKISPPPKVFSSDDFPSLCATKAGNRSSRSSKLSKAGTSNIPPGFNLTTETYNVGGLTSNKPPPGFNVTLNSVVRPLLTSDVTFTNSNGESFPITTSQQGYPSCTYTHPEDFQHRSRELTDTIQMLLGDDEEKFQGFRRFSGEFRQSVLSAGEYHRKCSDLMGEEKFSIIFPELLVLLPDIAKQQELLTVQNSFNKTGSQKKGAPKMQFLICATCQQVLAIQDFRPHMAVHGSESDFPAIAGGTAENAQRTHISWVTKAK